MMKMRKVFTFCLILIFGAAFSHAQDNFSVQARWADGYCSGASIVGNNAFIGNGSYLTSLNLSDPENPVFISSVLLGGKVQDVFVAGNYAYVSINTLGFSIIDISDPSSMILMGTGESYNMYSTKIFHNDGYIYLVDGGGMMVYDVSDPANPLYIYQFFLDGINDVFVQGNFAYLASKHSGMIIYDVEDPTQPVLIGFLAGNYWGNSIWVNGTTAYLGASQGIKIIDITDNSSPQEISSINANIKKLHFDDEKVFALVNYGGVMIVDVSTPSNPTVVGEIGVDNFNLPSNIIAGGNLLFICDGGLKIFDVSNPSVVNKLSQYVTGSYTSDIKVRDNFVFLTDWECGAFILNVTAKTDAVKISEVVPGLSNNNYRGSAISENLLCLGSFLGIYFVDISDIYNPEIIAELPTGGINDLEIIGDYLYVLFNNSISVLDISDPINPNEVKVIEGNATDIFVKDEYAYVITNSEDKVSIFDVSDPSNPQFVAEWNIQDINFARNIFVEGNYAYTCGHGLNITDISDPNTPVVVGVLLGDFWYSVVVNGDDAYIGSDDGVKRIDISDKENPVLTGEFESPYTYTGEIAFGSDLIYFAQAWNGLYILKDNFPTSVNENYIPQSFSLDQNYPNPFNPTTIIQFSIPAVELHTNVSLRVFDLLGREVTILLNKNLLPGKYEMEFNAEGLASGVYFYRLDAGSFSQTKKMLLMR